MLNPEDIKIIDPACGSGHILVEAYDVLKAIYEEMGYKPREIPQLILEKNLYGLDIDPRAAQLTGFALMMKARADDRRIFSRDVQLNVLSLVESGEWLADSQQQWYDLNLLGQSQQGENQDIFSNEVIEHPCYLLIHKTLVLFEQAKTFGSLIQVPNSDSEPLKELLETLKQLVNDGGSIKQKTAAQKLLPFIQQACLLVQKYDAVVANPPYMGGKGMNPALKAFAKKQFPHSKSDLFAMFMEHGFSLLKENGFNAQVNMQSWMFLSSYEKLRERLLKNHTLEAMVHMTNGVMGIAFGTAATIFNNKHIENHAGHFSYVRNEDLKEGIPYEFPIKNERLKIVKTDDFKKIPSSPIAYWVSDKVREIFANSPALGDAADARQGLATADNDRFLRLWHEVPLKGVGFGMENRERAQQSGLKWFPYNKGGQYRKWYGNQEFVVNWQHDGKEIREFVDDKGKQRSVIRNPNYYFKSSVSWSDVTSGDSAFRYFPTGFIHDSTGHSIFDLSIFNKKIVLSFCNNIFAIGIIKILNPTMHFHIGYFNNLPYPDKLKDISLNQIEELTFNSQNDWNTYETSWDFQSNPLIVGWVSDSVTRQNAAETVGLRDKAANPTYELAVIYAKWQIQNRETIAEMQRLEQENNRLFIDAYGLQDELTPNVPLEQITLTVNPKYRYGGKISDEALANRFQSDTLAELVSYAIGCMMGRYRLDKAGLIYAHAGNQDFDAIYRSHALRGNESLDAPRPDTENTTDKLKSVTEHDAERQNLHSHAEHGNDALYFPPDDDGIIPLTDQEWFADDATHRFRKFVRVIWGADNLQTNLDFIAESLCLYAIKAKNGESSLDTIRRYLSNQFYKDHLKTYKKRPIYWLFSSGKQKAFECLVYLHRYNESTLSRMRTEYVTPLLGKYEASAMVLEKQMQDASSTAESNRFKKSLMALEKKQTELSAFDDKLKHTADSRISLDLDEGVKVNYGKFGDLLAEVKAVTGKK